MIMGHVGFGTHFDKWIHAFHMPLFFFISGFFYKDIFNTEKFKNRIISRVKSLLIPYFVFAIISYIVDFLLNGYNVNSLRLFLFNTDEGGIPISGALWFLTALFFADIIYSLLDLLLEFRILHFAVIILSIIGFGISSIFPFQIPFGIAVSLVGIGFIHIARMIKKYQPLQKLYKLNVVISSSVVVITSILIFVNGYVNLRTCSYGFIPLFYFNSIGIIIGFWNLCRIVDSHISEKTWLYQRVISIGENSILYLCLNQVVIIIIRKCCSILGLDGIASSNIILIITIGSISIIGEIIMKSKIKCIFGKM